MTIMEAIVRGGDAAGVKIKIVDFSSEENPGLRIGKLVFATERSRDVAFVTTGDGNIEKVRYFLNEQIADVELDTYSKTEYIPGSIFVLWNFMLKAEMAPRPADFWQTYFESEVDADCFICKSEHLTFWDKHTCPYCPATLCSDCCTFGTCPRCEHDDAFWNDMRKPL